MNTFSLMIVPAIIAFVGIFALWRRCDVYGALERGTKEGIRTLLGILPSLAALLSAVHMLRASGAMDIAARILSPFTEFFGIPSECAPMALIRPFSGGAALAAGSELIETYGPDSYIGRMASVMLGSAETTFYTVAVYFGAISVNRTRYAIPAALIADLFGYIGSAVAVRLLF